MASADAAPHGNVKLKVVCYTIPMMGHALPLLSLAKTMAQRGHQMIFVSSKGLSQMNDLCSAVNVHYEGLEDGLSTEALKAIPDPTGPVFQEYFKKHEKFMLELLDREAPDLVLADYASGAAITAAREKKTLVVLNMALPGTLAYRMRILRFPGLRHVAPLITDRTQLYPVMFIGQVSLPAAEKTLTIVNTCPAMDGGVQLPPNYFSSGPLDGFEQSELNSEKHIDILAFLEKANAAKMPVAYITTGSLTQLSEEQIKALYDGFAACDVWVIWSLKKEKQALLKDLPERFHVSAWVPQAQIIQRPELMCVLTHCGWGGTMETMMAGKPVICYPGFGDQHENAKLLNSLGCGPILNPLKCTAKDVQAALEEVIANREAFTKKAQEVGKSLRESPGPVKTVELIEDVAKNGLGSLVDQPYHLSEPTGCQIS